MKTENNKNMHINYQELVDDIRHELAKVYHMSMNPALVLDAIDILIHEQTGVECVADSSNTCHTKKGGLCISKPPKEKDLWRVVYVIDVGANSAKAAAQEVYNTMSDPDSLAPVLDVMDPQGCQTTIDLSQK